GGRIGLGEVHEVQRARRNRTDSDREVDAGPLLDLLALAGEVDPSYGPHTPLRVGDASGVPVDDRVVGNARAKRVVPGAVVLGGAGALLGLVGTSAGLLARLPRGSRRRADGVCGDAPA